MPATSPGLESITSQLKPRAAPQRRYIRSSICAQSCASVPPAPAWMSRKALCESISPRNMRLNSSLRTPASSVLASRSISRAADSSFSLSASSSSSVASLTTLLTRSISSSSLTRRERSRPSSWARSCELQTAGSSSSRLTSSRRSFLRSYSKKPPQGDGAFLEIFERTFELADFHPTILAGRHRLCGQQMLDHELKAPLAHVFVAVQAVNQPRRTARQRRAVRIAVCEIKRDGVELSAPLRGTQTEFQVAFADQARGLDAKHAVEHRLRKARTPGSAGA